MGSTGRIVEEIGKYVISKNWDSYIAFGRSLTLSESKTIKIGNSFDNKLHGLKTRLFDEHGLGSKMATYELLKKIDSIKPDLIHLHNLHGYYLNYPLLFDYLSNQNAPVIWTLHDCWAFTGHCSYFSDINCQKWKTHCGKCPKTKNYPSSIFMDNSYRNFDIKKQVFNKLTNLTIVTVSEWLASMVRESFLNQYTVQVIHNGINLNDFYPMNWSYEIDAKYGFSNRKVLLALATAWGKNKGWDDYITLSELLPSDYVIVLVGVTKQQKSTLPSNMIGIERTESIQELASLYSQSYVILNLSYQETFGMTTIEGFACGTPAIVYNATASPELVTTETGIIVEPGDIKGVLFAVEEINSKGKEHYINRCRQLAIDRYNQDDRFNDYFELYKSSIQ
jgi:glycosyltransferase involved in cell wall biosynthesis